MMIFRHSSAVGKLLSPMQALTSASLPLVLYSMLPKKVKLSTSSTVTIFTFRTLLFPLWISRPKRVEVSATVLVFSCI